MVTANTSRAARGPQFATDKTPWRSFVPVQSARQVFSTLSNRESSRSHGVFNVKVVRIHNGAPNDPDSALVIQTGVRGSRWIGEETRIPALPATGSRRPAA